MSIDFEWLMNQAYQEALKSSDASTRIGALLVTHDGNIMARGHNDPSPGITTDDPRLLVRPDKYLICEHAERNAIYDAANNGIATRGLYMVTPWLPCADCARGVVACGASHIFSHAEAPALPGWSDSQNIGLEILNKGGVQVEFIHYTPDVPGILAGGTWHTPQTHTPQKL